MWISNKRVLVERPESAKTGRSQPELDYPKAAGGGLLDATLFQSLGFLEVSALTA
jgi:hypothetical protein